MTQWACRKSKTYVALTLVTLCMLSVPAGKYLGEYLRLHPLVKTLYQKRSFGSPDAKLWVVGLIGFPCDGCARADKAVRDLLNKYPGRIYYQIRYAYLSPSRDGRFMQAALRSECAAAQDRFGRFYEALMDDQKSWTGSADYRQALDRAARTAGLDRDKLAACEKEGTPYQAILVEIAQAGMLGIKSVPAFIVDGKKVESIDKLTEAVDNYFGGADA